MEKSAEANEITRLKQLLKLQLSIITQQQEAAKKKDAEFAKLKTQSQNFKLQLERNRRRVSLNRRNVEDETIIIPPTNVEVSPKIASPVPVKEEIAVVQEQDTSNEQQKEVLNLLLNLSENQSSRDVIEALNNASTMSPKSKAVCRLCVECDGCSVASDTILKLLVLAANTDFSEAKDKVKLYEEDKSWFESLGLKSQTSDCKSSAFLETSLPFERRAPCIVEPHWWFQTDWERVKNDDSLSLIPSYREVPSSIAKSSQLKASSTPEEVENTDDSTYMKRHLKFEQDEKRRKRWDIQRIREYRYTEKLKQRAIKQDANFTPVLNSFYGYLLDADSIQVEETLPVNVFGHPLPYLEPEEFSLESLHQQQQPPPKKRRQF